MSKLFLENASIAFYLGLKVAQFVNVLIFLYQSLIYVDVRRPLFQKALPRVDLFWYDLVVYEDVQS